MVVRSSSPTTPTTFSSERWMRFAESLSAEGAEGWALTMQVVKADVEACGALGRKSREAITAFADWWFGRMIGGLHLDFPAIQAGLKARYGTFVDAIGHILMAAEGMFLASCPAELAEGAKAHFLCAAEKMAQVTDRIRKDASTVTLAALNAEGTPQFSKGMVAACVAIFEVTFFMKGEAEALKTLEGMDWGLGSLQMVHFLDWAAQWAKASHLVNRG